MFPMAFAVLTNTLRLMFVLIRLILKTAESRASRDSALRDQLSQAWPNPSPTPALFPFKIYAYQAEKFQSK